ncbi:DUF4932 domain-containing protein [Mucilaginibacter sp. 22184]|uniref:DUF4932 domain-containing protein n=1 Tax=Mucilaginibacter sp. 22184 TaxID=3453887 RepID=UPI003F85B87E
MKTHIFLFTLFCFLYATFTKAHPLLTSPKVDQRVELLSIVFRLAGNDEYINDNDTGYVKAIHAHFDRFTNHPLIAYARTLRDSDKIGYDAPMSMAVDLQQAPSLSPIIPFGKQLPDKRWTEATANKFVILLKQFYKDADCDGFFRDQLVRYSIAEKRFEITFRQFDTAWYPTFYGQAAGESFNVIIGLSNGYANYGPHLNTSGQRKVYAIMGAFTFDIKGDPIFEPDNYLPTLIHEFNHSFVNELNTQFEKPLSLSGETIFNKQSLKMGRLAYGNWKTMFDEALVRAAVIIYQEQHGADTIKIRHCIQTEQALGFVWMADLVKLLENYEEQRKTNPNLKSFMPKIVGFYSNVAKDIDGYNERYLAKCAKVISVSPLSNGDQNVNAATSEITFTFDKPLDGIRYFFGPGIKGLEHYPKPLKISFSDDHKSVILKVNLKPNTEYQLNMAGSRMRTNDGYSVMDFSLTFKTDDK